MIKQSVARCSLQRLALKGDDRGGLIALEGAVDVPFDIARAYYIFGTKSGVTRGRHAHRELRQMAVAVRGSCVMLLDDGDNSEKITLDRPDLAVLIEPMIWHEMHDFSDDCVLLVLADKHYDERDYIRDKNDFLNLVRPDIRK